jgi:ElaB/YqjD/DUF883 family membrane-anchored ribosome-binding protein
MILTGDKVKEIRAGDRDNLKKFTDNAKTIKQQALDKIEEEHRGLMEKIKALMDEKEELLRAPMSKAELLTHAKDELNKCRAQAFSLLTKHLGDCQKGHSAPFYEIAMKGMFAEDKAYRLLWLFLSEKDIETIIKGFEEIGIPAAERDAKIAAIDARIGKLTAKLNNNQ